MAVVPELATYPFRDGVLRLVEEYTKPVGHDCINGSRGERAIRVFTPHHSRVNGVAYTRKYNLSPLLPFIQL